MRKLIASLLVVMAIPFGARAATTASVTLANEAGLPYSTTYFVNLNQFSGPQGSAGKLAVQVTYGSSTFASSTFKDGAKSTGSLTVVTNTGLVSGFATDNITVPATSLILASPATAQITVVSTTGLTGACLTVTSNGSFTFCNGHEWTAVATTSGTAQAIATGMNGVGGIVANWPGSGSVIYTSATIQGPLGAFGNGYRIASSTPTAISLSSTSYTGGLDAILLNDIITFNGNQYRNDYAWTDNSGTSTGTCISIAGLLNSFGVIKATCTASVVYATATVAGSAGNAFTLSSSTPGLTVATPAFIGGSDQASLVINGTTLLVSSAANTTLTAAGIAALINANSALNTIIVATNTANIVKSTSTGVGTVTNYTTVSSTPAALTFSGATMTGGTNSAYTLNSAVINLPAHGFTKALPVLYSGSPVIGGLATGTTYFVVVIDSNNIELSSTSVVAQSGNGIVITSSSSQTTADTYTLAPLGFSGGSAGAKWQVSNDAINWVDFTTTVGNVVVPIQTFTPVFPSTTSVQDFGNVDYQYMRYNVTGPTQGGVNLKVILNAKD